LTPGWRFLVLRANIFAPCGLKLKNAEGLRFIEKARVLQAGQSRDGDSKLYHLWAFRRRSLPLHFGASSLKTNWGCHDFKHRNKGEDAPYETSRQNNLEFLLRLPASGKYLCNGAAHFL
jgi:hypothetical protein